MPYHSYDELIRLFTELEAKRRDVISHEVIGTTVQGRSMYLFRIGYAKKPAVFFMGSIHGNEHPGAELLYMYAEWLVNEKEPDASWILHNIYTLILPVANPDGFDAYKRVNANCVDVNRNFPKGWGGAGTLPGSCCDICRGYSPLDQPESKAISDVVARYKPKWALDIHSGEEILAYPWCCWMDRPPDHDKFETVCEKYTRLANERGVKPYSHGQVAWSYPPVDLATPVPVTTYPYVIYVCCGTTIDSWYDKGVLSMTLEATSPFNPSYDSLVGTYFPRFLPLAITLSRECAEVRPVTPISWLPLLTMAAGTIIIASTPRG